MNSRAEDGPRAWNGAPPVSASIVPAFSAAFWAYWLLAAMAGAIAGQALNHVYVHRSGRVIVVLMLCFLAMSMVQGTTRRLPRLMFWTAAFLLGLMGAILAEATDVSMGIGDIGAVLLIAILLIFSFVICYRLTGHLPGPTDGSNVRGFFWTTAMLGQTVAGACADWILDPGGSAGARGDRRDRARHRGDDRALSLHERPARGVVLVRFRVVGDRGRARWTFRHEID